MMMMMMMMVLLLVLQVHCINESTFPKLKARMSCSSCIRLSETSQFKYSSALVGRRGDMEPPLRPPGLATATPLPTLAIAPTNDPATLP